eukprot:243730-Prorocentrum_minimum.AAC.6
MVGEFGQVQVPAGPKLRLKGWKYQSYSQGRVHVYRGGTQMSPAPITNAAGEQDSPGRTPCVVINGDKRKRQGVQMRNDTF